MLHYLCASCATFQATPAQKFNPQESMRDGNSDIIHSNYPLPTSHFAAYSYVTLLSNLQFAVVLFTSKNRYVLRCILRRCLFLYKSGITTCKVLCYKRRCSFLSSRFFCCPCSLLLLSISIRPPVRVSRGTWCRWCPLIRYPSKCRISHHLPSTRRR